MRRSSVSTPARNLRRQPLASSGRAHTRCRPCRAPTRTFWTTRTGEDAFGVWCQHLQTLIESRIFKGLFVLSYFGLHAGAH
jgi:hypothetical protein